MSEQVTQAAVLASEIGEAIGFSFADAEPGDEHLNEDGAWEYHFETDPSWGFVAAGPDGPIETTYPEWGEIEVDPYRWCVFHDGALVAVFSPKGGTVGGFVALEGVDDVADLEPAMCDAFERERDALRDGNGGKEIVTDGGEDYEEGCVNCGIGITDDVSGDTHPIRLRHPSNAGDVYCEACFFQTPDHGQYERTGDQILDEDGEEYPTDSALSDEWLIDGRADPEDDVRTDGGFEIEGEDCGRCGGSGQITKAVAGRSGVVPCPECENVPESVIPNDSSDDPQERLAEIEERSDDLTEKKERVRGLRSDIHEARALLAEAASSDLVPDDTGTKFDHITDQIEMLLRSFDVARGIYYEQDQLGREKNELYTLLEYTGGEDG